MKIGLLPLYIKLYDDIGTSRTRLTEFHREVTELFEKKGVTVVTTDFCRIKPEFEAAVSLFEDSGVDAIVTLHMAYSPSLESIDVLTKTKLPVIVLDSTPTLEFTPEQDPSHIGPNHGIHGVMDMCSMLKRLGKPYAIAAGHYLESDSIDRVIGFVRSAIAAKALCGMKVGLAGGSFDGMGDFLVEPSEMKERFGVTVETIAPDKLRTAKDKVTSEEIRAELELDKERYDFDENIVPEELKEYTRACLGLRRCIDEEGYGAFSVNFLNVAGIGTMPFTECCKAMERGIGYAGEGDALTAAFTGALLSAYPETGFVEIFCPDWKNNTVFLSHMGEMNYRIADGKPLFRRNASKVVRGDIVPYAGYSKMKAGKGVYVNVSRDSEDYQLLVTSAEILPAGEDNFPRSMRGWMRAELSSTAEFLEALSKNGATHHSSFVYGATAEELEYFGKLLGMKTVVI